MPSLTSSPRRAAFMASTVSSFGAEWVERQGALGDGPHEQHTEGVRKRQASGGVDRRGFFLDANIDSGTYDGVSGHENLWATV